MFAGYQCRRQRSSHEAALGSGRAGVHVASPVQVIVDFRRASEHAGIKEDRERGGFQIGLGQFTTSQRLPQHLQQQRRDHRIDVHAIHVA